MNRVLCANILFGGIFLCLTVPGAIAAPLGKDASAPAVKTQPNKPLPAANPTSQAVPQPRPAPSSPPASSNEQGTQQIHTQPPAASKDLIEAPSASVDTSPVIKDIRKPVIITREDIERHYGYDIAQVLQAFLNLDVRRVGGPGAQSEIFVLGAEQRHIAIYVDDTRVSDRALNERRQSDHVQGGIPWHMIPLSQIGWIEIREGLEATRQGEGAIAASIHIYTRRPVHRGSSFGGVIANPGTQGIEFGYNSSETNAHMDFALMRHEGISATNPRASSFNGDLDGALEFSARAGYQGKWSDTSLFELTAMAFNSHNNFDQGESVTNWQMAHAKIATLSEQATWHQQLRASAWHKLTTYSDTSDHRLRTAHSEIMWENKLRLGTRTLWRIDAHFLVDAARWTSAGTPQPRLDTKFTTNTGVGMSLDFPISQNDVELSARYDRHVPFGDISTYGVRWGRDVLPSRLHASVALHSGYSAPALEDRYSNGESGGLYKGSSEVTFEKSTRLDTLWHFRFDTDHDAEIMLYGNRIDSVLSRSGTAFVIKNDERYELSGARLNYRYKENDWQFRLAGDLQSASGRNGALPYRPARKLLVALTKRISGGYAMEGTARLIDARKTTQGKLDPYTIFDLSTTKNFAREYDVGLVVSNLFDKIYETDYGFNMPGRTLLLRVRYTPRG